MVDILPIWWRIIRELTREWRRDMKIYERKVKSVLTKSRVSEYTLNPYVGCFHRCSYCYATFIRKFRNIEEKWGDFVEVKINAPEVLRKEIVRKKPKRVFLSTVCDPYQPIEAVYRITRKCLEVFLEFPFLDIEVSILTKSTLILRDIDVFKKMKSLELGVTVTTDREEIRKIFEPRAPSIERRLKVLKILKREGLRTYAFVGPMLPMDPENLARKLHKIVDYVLIDRMNYIWKVKKLYKKLNLEYALNEDFFLKTKDKLLRYLSELGVQSRYVET